MAPVCRMAHDRQQIHGRGQRIVTSLKKHTFFPDMTLYCSSLPRCCKAHELQLWQHCIAMRLVADPWHVHGQDMLITTDAPL